MLSEMGDPRCSKLCHNYCVAIDFIPTIFADIHGHLHAHDEKKMKNGK